MATPTPYIERHPGELIQAEEWNDIQIQARTELQAHTHSGGAHGTPISYTHLTDVPTTFAPAPHQHSSADLTVGDLPAGASTDKLVTADANGMLHAVAIEAMATNPKVIVVGLVASVP